MTLVYRTQQLTEYWANSGLPQDIQTAINVVHAAGDDGIVHVPEGTAQWNGETVRSYGGISILGAGAGCLGHQDNWAKLPDLTVLHNNKVAAPPMFVVDGSNLKPWRISGICFEGTVVSANDDIEGIAITTGSYDTLDGRVDHCSFIDFPNIAVAFSNPSTGRARGIIDHCFFDNPYKDIYGGSWAYGVIGFGQYRNWDDNITKFLGKYETAPTNQPMIYIEDCHFNRNRHSVASNQCTWYVTRYNLFEGHGLMDNFGLIDVHGTAGAVDPSGGRGLESYNNVISNGMCHQIRGGGGVIFNNTCLNVGTNPDADVGVVRLSRENVISAVRKLWIWNNTRSPTDAVNINDKGSYVEGVDYSHQTPTRSGTTYILPSLNDSVSGPTGQISYTPYPYPHPLTIGETPQPPSTTPFSSELEEGDYVVTMPLTVSDDQDVYMFKQWEDGSTNPVRTISLQSDITITATYEPMLTYNLTIATTAGGTTEPEPDVYVKTIGDIVTVTAKEDEGYTFKHFELDGEIKMQNPINVGMDADHTLLAVFVETGPPLPLPLMLLLMFGVPAGAAGTIAVARKGGE